MLKKLRNWIDRWAQPILYIFVLLVVSLFCITECSGQSVHQVDSVLKAHNIKHADIVLKQSILETGWYTSYSCKERKNLFGFRYKGEYLKFDTWEESIAYYARWQSRHLKEGYDNYYTFLECLYKNRRGECIRYAQDNDYIDKLKSLEI